MSLMWTHLRHRIVLIKEVNKELSTEENYINESMSRVSWRCSEGGGMFARQVLFGFVDIRYSVLCFVKTEIYLVMGQTLLFRPTTCPVDLIFFASVQCEPDFHLRRPTLILMIQSQQLMQWAGAWLRGEFCYQLSEHQPNIDVLKFVWCESRGDGRELLGPFSLNVDNYAFGC